MNKNESSLFSLIKTFMDLELVQRSIIFFFGFIITSFVFRHLQISTLSIDLSSDEHMLINKAI